MVTIPPKGKMIPLQLMEKGRTPPQLGEVIIGVFFTYNLVKVRRQKLVDSVALSPPRCFSSEMVQMEHIFV